ncbi:MAG: signal peptidase I [Dehalococcoidia bacterium]
MTRFDETEFSPEIEGRAFETPGNRFDPLFEPWEEQVASPVSQGDSLFEFQPVPETDENVGFAPYSADWASTIYPDRYQPAYQERLTELQERLRAETIVLPRPDRRWAVTVRELAETLLLAALLFLAVRASFQNFRVEGASMQPSLQDGDYLIVNKLNYAEIDLGPFDFLPFFDSGEDSTRQLMGDPERGDIIVFRAPINPDRDFIKRIIGLPGDTVDIRQGDGVYVNNQLLQEGYIQGATSCGQQCVVHIPLAGSDAARAECGSDACYFVMGDNRQNSSDSRQGWLLPLENIIGKAMVTYWNADGPDIGLAPNHSVGLAEEAQ